MKTDQNATNFIQGSFNVKLKNVSRKNRGDVLASSPFKHFIEWKVCLYVYLSLDPGCVISFI